ncbi:hypothetical protein [Alistipes sp.]|uniref:hypothetical protein n=1 Tax=Alistipes sp. TaxID=1872444 RepID=UPI003A87CF53
MSRWKTILLLLLVVPWSVSGAAPSGLPIREKALGLVTRMNASLVQLQNTDRKDPDRGGIWCPACGLYHTRAAEAMYPLALEFSMTGNRQRLRQAMAVGNWLIRQQQPQGEWQETPETWTGTTADQVLMMLLTYPIVEPHLTPAERERWLHSMAAASDYLTRVMSNRFASINYCATTAAALAEAYGRFGKAEYAAKARMLARMIVAKMNPEWFVEGEGARVGDYKYGVDLGYNLEMTLWGLARYAKLLDDERVWTAVCRSAANHLWFVYPDGMLDLSAGIRSNKWIICGSGTSDGCHPLFALLEREDAAFGAASYRNMECLERQFSRSGLLGFGPDYDSVFETPPCIYPTFAKAKSLAMALAWSRSDRIPAVILPTDRDTCRWFRTLNTAVVRRGGFCGTVTAYGYKAREGASSKYMHRPTGGVMSALWLEGWGLLQASSQTEYHRWEPMSFPQMPEVCPLTPRIEMRAGGDVYTNLYEYDATFDFHPTADSIVCTAYGRLCDRDRRPCGIAYGLTHVFGDGMLEKRYEILIQTEREPVRIIEPIVCRPGLEIRVVDASRIDFVCGTEVLTLQARGGSLRLDTDDAAKYRQPYPALTAVPVVIDIPHDAEGARTQVSLIYQLKHEER